MYFIVERMLRHAQTASFSGWTGSKLKITDGRVTISGCPAPEMGCLDMA